MRILIDGDGCPVVNQAVKVATSFKVECIILCDTSHRIEKQGATTIIVSKGADSVDFKLVNMLQTGDIVITQDYGLAAMALSREAIVLNQDGLMYTNDNIDSLLLARHTAKKIRESGKRLKGLTKRTPLQNEQFERVLEEVVLNQIKL